MKSLVKNIAFIFLISLALLIVNYYSSSNTFLIFIYVLGATYLAYTIFKLSKNYRFQNHRRNITTILATLIILCISIWTNGLERRICKVETALLKSKRIKEINYIKIGNFTERKDGVRAYTATSSFPKISWFGKNDILLDNLSKDSFRVRFFLPKSEINHICLVYSEDKSFNASVKHLNKLDHLSTHIKLEDNWYLTSYIPGTSRFKQFFP